MPTVGPPINPRVRRWTDEELALFGKLPDREIVARTGHSLHSVVAKRRDLRVPAVNPKRRAWTSEEAALLGTASDEEVARRLSRSDAAVKARRQYLRIRAFRDSASEVKGKQ